MYANVVVGKYITYNRKRCTTRRRYNYTDLRTIGLPCVLLDSERGEECIYFWFYVYVFFFSCLGKQYFSTRNLVAPAIINVSGVFKNLSWSNRVRDEDNFPKKSCPPPPYHYK